MRLGVLIGGGPARIDELIGQVRAAAEAGLKSAFFTQLFSWDAVELAAFSAREVPGIDVGTAVTQTYPRHPITLAGQALTSQVVSRDRFTLGIGPSHPPIVEGQFGYSYERPAAHVREYLSVLQPLLRGEQVDYHGKTLSAVGRTDVPDATPPSVLLAALGPVMLRIAGELADGTVTMWTGAQTIGDYVAPTITRAAAEAGRPAPRVVASVIMSVTADPETTRQRVAARLGAASQLPSYRSMLGRQGKSTAEETIAVGDERTIEQTVRSFADAGATELLASLVGDEWEQARTRELLSSLATSL